MKIYLIEFYHHRRFWQLLLNSDSPIIERVESMQKTQSFFIEQLSKTTDSSLIESLTFFLWFIIILMITQNKLILLIVFLLLAQLTLTKKDKDYTYEEFKHQHKKNYDGSEDNKRRQNFNKHMEYLIEQENEGRTVPPNDFLDWSDEELSKLNGLKLPQEDDSQEKNNGKQKKPKKVSSGFSVAPAAFDYRDYGKVSSVKNQGACGSCWAFAATAHYESLLLMLTSQEKDLAEQYVLQCTSGSSCNGGWPHDAIQVVRNKGYPEELKFPYKANDTYYSEICTTSSSSFIKLPANIIVNRYDKNIYTNVQQLKQLLISNGPMTVGVKAGHNAFYYPLTGGYIEQCPTSFPYVDHVVLLVGYTSSHWIIKNSWGTGWGSSGFAYIPFTNDCGILKNVWVIQVDQSFDPSPDPNPNPQPTDVVTLNIEMGDTYGDGWNGNIIGIKQNNQIVAVFGENFTWGFSATQSIQIPGGISYSVVVSSYGSWRSEISFTIKNSNGQTIFYYPSGSSFSASNVFTTVCVGSCDTTPKKYYLTLTDTYGDGWNGNTIIVKQDGTSNEYGSLFTSGSQYGPIEVSLIPSKVVTVVPGVLGSWRGEVGFVFKDSFGGVIAKRTGAYYYGTDTLLNFIPNSVNTFPVSLAPPELVKADKVNEDAQSGNSQTSETLKTTETTAENNEFIGLLIAVICLSVVVLVLLGSLIFTLMKISKNIEKKRLPDDTVGTASNIITNDALGA